MKPCNALSTHYSAYIDGELTPLESVAIRRHLNRCPLCRKDVQGLENMKLSVHMHGRDIAPSDDLKVKLTAAMHELETQKQRKTYAGLAVGILAAAIIVVVASPQTSQSSVPMLEEWVEETNTASPTGPRTNDSRVAASIRTESVLNSQILGTLVKRHQAPHEGNPTSHPAIMSFEPLPVRFIDEGSHFKRVLNASYQRCLQTQPGASLAVLDSNQVALPMHVQMGLDATGVYAEQWGHIEIRISQSNRKIFVLLTNKAPAWNSPI